MRVTIGQINTTNGDFEGNTARILTAIEQARKERSDLIVFPEGISGDQIRLAGARHPNAAIVGGVERIARHGRHLRTDHEPRE